MVPLIPTVPNDKTLIVLEEIIISKSITNKAVIKEYVLLTKRCRAQNAFSFNNGVYKHTFGTSIENHLLPFIPK